MRQSIKAARQPDTNPGSDRREAGSRARLRSRELSRPPTRRAVAVATPAERREIDRTAERDSHEQTRNVVNDVNYQIRRGQTKLG